MTTYAEQLSQAKTTVTITPSPLIFEKVGETWRGLYLGQREFTRTIAETGEVKRNTVAHFFDGTRVVFNMGAQLTRQLETLPVGVSVEIKLTALQPNKHGGGKTKIYDVTPLDLPIQNLAEMFGGFLNITAPAPQDLLPPPAEVAPAVQLTEEKRAETNAALWGE